MRHQLRRELTYQRVLLAIHALADPHGLYCQATNAELARASGRYVDTMKGVLRQLEAEGQIKCLGGWYGLNRRVIVLMDHPDSPDLVRAFDASRHGGETPIPIRKGAGL